MVLDTWQSEADGRLRVLIEVPRGALRCRSCGCSRVHIDEWTRREWKSAPLVMNPEHLKQNEKVDEKAQLHEALKLNESLSVAYDLKEDLRQFWNQKSKPAAEKFLEA